MADYKYHYNTLGKVRPFFTKTQDSIIPVKQMNEQEKLPAMETPSSDIETEYPDKQATSPATSPITADNQVNFEQELLAVLGNDLTDFSIKQLQQKSNGSVQRAINYFFENPENYPINEVSSQPVAKRPVPETETSEKKKQKVSIDRPEKSKKSVESEKPKESKKSKQSDESGDEIEVVDVKFAGQKAINSTSLWESRIIGTFQADIWATRSGSDMVRFGDTLRFERGGLNAHRNTIVRVVNERNNLEFARLTENNARFAAILMESQLCSFSGSCIYSEKTLRPGDTIVIEMKCHLLRSAFGHNLLDDDSSENTHFDNSKETGSEALLRLRQQGLNALFTKLGLSEPVPIDTNNLQFAPESDDNDTVTQEELDSLYQRSAPPDAGLAGVDPPESFKCQLRPYQRKGLEWMLYRETPDSSDPRYNDPNYQEPLNPLWQEIPWPFDKGSFYVNFHNGELSASFPSDNKGKVLGGILADEMGLGKTISTLALIHSSMSSTLSTNNDSFARGTTLVVCPMSLLTQWESEANKSGLSNVYVCYGAGSQTNIRDILLRSETPPSLVLTSYGTLHADHRRLKEFRTSNDLDCQWYDDPRSVEFGLFGIKFHRVVLDEGHNIRNRTTIAARACNDLRAEKKWILTGTPVVNKLEDLYSLVKFLGVEPWTNFALWRACITRPFQSKGKAGKGYVSALKVVQGIMEPILLRRTKDMESEDGKPLITLPSKTVTIDRIEFSDNERALYDWVYTRVRDMFKKSIDEGEAFKNYTTILTQILRLRQACCHPSLVLNIAKYQQESIDDEAITEVDQTSGNGGQIINMNNLDLKKIISNFTPSQVSGESKDEERRLDSFPASVAQQITGGLECECPICTENIAQHQAAVTSCFHVGCLDCLLEHMAYQRSKNKTPQCPLCRKNIDCVYLIQKSGMDSNALFLKRYRSTGQSAKIRALLNELRKQSIRGKVVVFSQFTGFLDLIENELNYSGFPTLRFDGSLSQSKRAKILETFSNDATPYVLLMSLKAGGVGLNLVSSHQVYLMDPWWSFAIESQAIDRVHRMGQTHDVTVTRFIVQGTVEERMLRIQERKSHLAVTLGMTKEEQKERRLEDIMLLFDD